MTKGKPRGRPFKKGNTAGKGRPRNTEEEKKLTSLTRTKFNSIVRKYLDLNKEGLKAIAQDKSTPALDLMVISVMNKAIVQGDEKKMNWFLEQLFGKLIERTNLNLSGRIESRPTFDLSKLSVKELKQLKSMVEKQEMHTAFLEDDDDND